MGRPGGRISAVISDVDGTLVADDKSLPEANRRAVARLVEAGVAFALISSRPPRGMAEVIKSLDVPLVVAGFNGGVISTAENEILEQHLLAPDAARRTVQSLTDGGADVWVFAGQAWFRAERQLALQRARDSHGAVRAHHRSGLRRGARQGRQDRRRERRCRAAGGLRGRIAGRVVGQGHDRAVPALLFGYHRRLANKGAGVRAIARTAGRPARRGRRDRRRAQRRRHVRSGGLSIAMGNAEPAVQQAANHVTGDNNDGGRRCGDGAVYLRSGLRRMGDSPRWKSS